MSGIVHHPDQHPSVAMPVGGIGTGSVAVGSDGGLRQWQLHNVGNHRGDLPGSFFALRWQQLEPARDGVHLLQQQRTDPGAQGRPATAMVDDDWVPGWQHELLQRWPGTSTSFRATYPLAEVEHTLTDAATGEPAPVAVTMRALNPMQPGDLAHSSLPVAMFEFDLTNTSQTETRVWLAGSVHNAVGLDPRLNPDGVRAPGYGGNTNRLRRERTHPETAHLLLDNHTLDPLSPSAGQLVLSCRLPEGGASRIESLTQFTQPDELLEFLRILAPWGDISPSLAQPAIPVGQTSAPQRRYGASPAGQSWLGGLVSQVVLAPGQTRTVRFAISWWFPNRMLDFVQFGPDRPELGATRFWLGNHYTTQFDDALDVAHTVMSDWTSLWQLSRTWVEALRALPLSEQAIAHYSAQLVPLRTPTVFRTPDGQFFGFEGVLGASSAMWSGVVGGSCPLNCTHVWNYAFAPAALFGEVEASMRACEFDIMQAPDGSLPHRVYLPTYLPQLWQGIIGGPLAPALDGMCGAVLKTLRELQRGSIDRAWLAHRWTKLTALMDHICTSFDPENTGLFQGVQPSTHDIHLHGPNPYMATWWLAALRAAEELALVLDDHTRAQAWRDRFERASAATDDALFNGDYYVQHPDPNQSLEHQWGEACLADQLIGQWWAHSLGLGYLLPREHVRTTLSSIIKHNLRSDFDESTTIQRPYAGRGESGVAMCTWPRGGRPTTPTLYCDEVWTGSEYQLAAHCRYEGLNDEADQILAAIWQRHDGSRRNPFNEVECGDHYARSMAGWSALEAQLGLRWQQPQLRLEVGVAGTIPWVSTTGWGVVETTPTTARVRCHHGRLELNTLITPAGAWSVERTGQVDPITPELGWVELTHAGNVPPLEHNGGGKS